MQYRTHEFVEPPQQFRAQLDAAVTFTNGGSLNATGFRVDVPGPDVTVEEIGQLFVRSLGLLMVGTVTASNVTILEESHKGTRGGPSDAAPAATPDAHAEIVDLSHPVEAGMVTYPGLPGPQISTHLTREDSRAHYSPGTEFAIDRISMLGNTGTYLDSPYHRYADGADLAGLPLERLVDLPAVVVRVTGSSSRAVDLSALTPYDVAGCAVLLHTGWDVHWRTSSYGRADAPYLTAEAARWLVGQGAALVGIDSVNIDDMADPDRPAHSVLLRAGVPVVEHLTSLSHLPVHGARFTALPAPVEAFGTFPVRAVATIR